MSIKKLLEREFKVKVIRSVEFQPGLTETFVTSAEIDAATDAFSKNNDKIVTVHETDNGPIFVGEEIAIMFRESDGQAGVLSLDEARKPAKIAADDTDDDEGDYEPDAEDGEDDEDPADAEDGEDDEDPADDEEDGEDDEDPADDEEPADDDEEDEPKAKKKKTSESLDESTVECPDCGSKKIKNGTCSDCGCEGCDGGTTDNTGSDSMDEAVTVCPACANSSLDEGFVKKSNDRMKCKNCEYVGETVEFTPDAPAPLEEMAMTHKHYIRIAAIIKGLSKQGFTRKQRSIVANELSSVFSDDNSAFNKSRFLTASGLSASGAAPAEDDTEEPGTTDESMGNTVSLTQVMRIKGIKPDDAKKVRAIIAKANTDDEVSDALDEIAKLIGGERDTVNGDQFKPYWAQCVLAYVNMGDTYDQTVLYDTNRGWWSIGTMGDWVEKFSEKYAIENMAESISSINETMLTIAQQLPAQTVTESHTRFDEAVAEGNVSKALSAASDVLLSLSTYTNTVTESADSERAQDVFDIVSRDSDPTQRLVERILSGDTAANAYDPEKAHKLFRVLVDMKLNKAMVEDATLADVSDAVRNEAARKLAVLTPVDEADDDAKFDAWMKKVDAALDKRINMVSADIDDAPYRDWFDSGVSPTSAAARAIKNADMSESAKDDDEADNVNESQDDDNKPRNVRVSFPTSRLSEFAEIADKSGANGKEDIKENGAVTIATLSEEVATRMQPFFTGNGVVYNPS